MILELSSIIFKKEIIPKNMWTIPEYSKDRTPLSEFYRDGKSRVPAMAANLDLYLHSKVGELPSALQCPLSSPRAWRFLLSQSPAFGKQDWKNPFDPQD